MLALEIKNLCKEYPGVKALKSINFFVTHGSIHGLLGPNGAGKSTTLKIITGLIKASSGQVLILGEDLSDKPEIPKTMIGILPEDPPLYKEMRVRDYLNFVAGIHNVPSAFLKQYVDEAIVKTHLENQQKRLIGHLSKGYQQRVALAQALVFKPKILILDEPTTGLDPASIVEFRHLILSLKGEQTILLSTHQLHEVDQCCEDITIVRQGEVVVTGKMNEIMKNFEKKQVITIEIAGVIEQKILEELKQFSFIESIQVEGPPMANKKLTFYINEKKDQRSFLGKYLMERGHHLLSLTKQTQQLEDIFLQVTD